MHAESFSGPDALIRHCLNRKSRIRSRSDLRCRPIRIHGLTCPWALAHRILSEDLPDTAFEPGKHFLCNDHCQTAVSQILSPWYGLSEKPFFSPGFWLEFTHPTQWQLCTAHIDTVDMSAHSITPLLPSIIARDFTRFFTHFILCEEKSADRRTFTNGLSRH